MSGAVGASETPQLPDAILSGPEGGHLFTLAEAAAACNVSRDTIKRRNKGGRFPHAVKTPEGWKIPLVDLLADGLKVNPLGQGEGSPEGAAPPDAQAARLAELEAENRRLRDVLDERDRALRIAERALAALPAPADAPPLAPQPAETPHAPRRRWWNR